MKSGKGNVPREIGEPERAVSSWQTGYVVQLDESGMPVPRAGMGRYYSESVLIDVSTMERDVNEI